MHSWWGTRNRRAGSGGGGFEVCLSKKLNNKTKENPRKRWNHYRFLVWGEQMWPNENMCPVVVRGGERTMMVVVDRNRENKNQLQIHATKSATMRFSLPDWTFYIMHLEKWKTTENLLDSIGNEMLNSAADNGANIGFGSVSRHHEHSGSLRGKDHQLSSDLWPKWKGGYLLGIYVELPWPRLRKRNQIHTHMHKFHSSHDPKYWTFHLYPPGRLARR